MPVKLIRYGIVGIWLIAAAVLSRPLFAATVVVDSTTDIFLASQPDTTGVTGYFGTDTAPDNSPVLIAVTGGATLTFSASGSASVDDSCFAGPDGGCYPDESGFSPAPASGTYKGPATALIGVFLDDNVTDVSNGPASLDYTDSANLNLLTNTPGLGQIFFIGDGLTDASLVQQFIAPTGATRLFLAVADSIGASSGNEGSFTVDYTESVPEPASWALMIGGLGLAGAAMRRRAQRAALAI